MPRRIITLLCLAAVLAVALLTQSTQAAVMSIDYGTEWFKVGLIKPGIPLDVALNKDSKRKTQAVVTLRGVERLYGSDSVALSSRFPQFTYPNIKAILGKPYEDEHCVEYRERFVNRMESDEHRRSPVFRLADGTTLITVEELLAYQFQNARDQAKNTAGEDVKDVVITVAPFATQYERQAILDAAELAGLNVLSLIHDETAVALNYAINRDFSNTPEHHIFYDMGAGSTVASLVSFSHVETKDGRTKKTVPQLEVRAVGFDRTLGGHEFDVRLRDWLADKFMQQHSTSDIRKSSAAMTRLLKEATRVKQILSANTETTASVESLFEDVDFKVKVSRSELETLCADLLERVENPIETVLKATGMSKADIKSLVLVGGSVRIPAVQRHLSKAIGAEKIAKNVNGDEAAVLGAAFRGASLSNQFRLTKQIKIKDVTVFPVDVSYQAEGEDGHKTMHTTLFNEFGTIGTRKVMTFKRETDFDFDLTYGKTAEEQDVELGLDKIAKVKITGLTAAMEKYKEDITGAEHPPKVRVAIEMSSSGLLSVPEASLTLQVKDTGGNTFSDKVKSFFSSKEDQSGSEEPEKEPIQSEHNQTEAEMNAEKKPDEPKDKEASIKKIPLTIEFIHTGFLPMTDGEKTAALKRIRELDQLDEKRRLREESRNNLEAFVYRVQDFLYDEIVSIVATEKQQEDLREKLSETSDWLYDEGEKADTPAYIERLRMLQQLERPITFRRLEYIQREKNIEKIQTSIELARVFIEKVKSIPDDERHYTDEEIDALHDHVARVENWKNDKVAAQEKLPNHVEPVLTTAETRKKCQELDEALLKLAKKKKPKIVKPTAPKNDTTEEQEQEKPPAKEAEEKQEHDEL
ncbi:heat shock protein 70 family [Dichotomocladium elegans]|nr:heat shock protein 70 family [Dichotomocladium elegans]